MPRKRFPITSDQMELLLEFEAAGSLEKLADSMAKDPSVVSRNLQKLALDFPVLSKVQRKWCITPLGRQVNVLSREHMSQIQGLLGRGSQKRKSPALPTIPANSLLLLINVQKALQDPARGRRSNAKAEQNILRLLEYWRKGNRAIVHIKHVSENPASFFYRKSPGVEFISGVEPRSGEKVMEKSKASALVGTQLEKLIRHKKPDALVLIGFTGGECIDATARQASDLGFNTMVVGDATATFDITGPDGKLHRADKVHKNILANLHAMFAEVIETDTIIR